MRLIDADALMEQFEETHQFYIFAWGGDYSKMPLRYKAACDELVNCIAEVVNAPTIDAVPVVRCKDCKWWSDWGNGTGSCELSEAAMRREDATDFCSFGERRNDETD